MSLNMIKRPKQEVNTFSATAFFWANTLINVFACSEFKSPQLKVPIRSLWTLYNFFDNNILNTPRQAPNTYAHIYFRLKYYSQSVTLIRAAHKGLRTPLGNVDCVWCLKLRAKNREACCLMEGFLLSITDKTSSDKCWRVVFKEKEKVLTHFDQRRLWKCSRKPEQIQSTETVNKALQFLKTCNL